jgi:probable rRNA maturation factor
MEIFFRNRSMKKLIPALQLRYLTLRIIGDLLEQYPFQNPQLSILFVDDDQIRAMNKKHRKLDRPTDVLSFPMLEEKKGKEPSDEPTPLGDIVISLESAARQAKEQEHPMKKEIALLLVHGFLHLLHFDDQKPKERREMFSLQQRWMEQFEKKGIF